MNSHNAAMQQHGWISGRNSIKGLYQILYPVMLNRKMSSDMTNGRPDFCAAKAVLVYRH